MRDYLATLPLPEAAIPEFLKMLLTPVELSPNEKVEVMSLVPRGDNKEAAGWSYSSSMWVVPESDSLPLSEFKNGPAMVAAYGTPTFELKGSHAKHLAGGWGYDYVVAGWNRPHLSFNLSDKIWSTLDLTPRCLEDQRQVMVYDDLGAQVLNVAEGVFSAPYWYKAPFSIRWTILNEYLRRYLWIRGSVGVRQISCLGLLEDSQELRDLMRGETEVTLGVDEDWYEIHIRENVDGLLLDVRAAVPVVSCTLCPVSEPRVENWTNPYPHHFL